MDLLVLLGILLDITDLLCNLLKAILVVRVLMLQLLLLPSRDLLSGHDTCF